MQIYWEYSWGLHRQLMKDIHLKYSFSTVVGAPPQPLPQLSGLGGGEVTELWMYFPYWIWSNSAANVLCIQMRLFKAELNWTQMQIAMAEHFLLAFVLSVCVLKYTVKDSQPRCLAFWESKQSCPPPLNIDAVVMCSACWECVSKNVLIRDGLKLGDGSWRNDQAQKRQESKLSAEEWEMLQMNEGTVVTRGKDLKFTRYDSKRKKVKKKGDSLTYE